MKQAATDPILYGRSFWHYILKGTNEKDKAQRRQRKFNLNNPTSCQAKQSRWLVAGYYCFETVQLAAERCVSAAKRYVDSQIRSHFHRAALSHKDSIVPDAFRLPFPIESSSCPSLSVISPLHQPNILHLTVYHEFGLLTSSERVWVGRG